MNSHLLSICIPAFKRLDLTRNTIKSILSQSDDVLSKMFQIVLVDNDPDAELSTLKDEFGDDLVYIKSDAIGFANSLFALRSCSGEVIKLHNNTMLFKEGALKTLVELSKKINSCNSLALLTNGNCNRNNVAVFSDFNEFMHVAGYQVTWSNCLLIKSKTLREIEGLVSDPFFPHLEVLLNSYDLDSYCLNDNEIFSLQFVKNKGGYNVFKVFSENLFVLLRRYNSLGYINSTVIDKIRSDLLKKFFPINIFKSIFTSIEMYDCDSAVVYLSKMYKTREIVYIFMLAAIYPLAFAVRKFLIRVKLTFAKVG